MNKQNIKKFVLAIPFSVFIYNALKKILNTPGYIKDLLRFKKENDGRFTLPIREIFPCLLDKTSTTNFEPHYTYHPGWAARIIAKNKPEKHIDIASTLHFATIVSAFVPVEFSMIPDDYRSAGLIINADPDTVTKQSWACGCFVFTK